MNPLERRGRLKGSAAIELLAIIPFALLLMAAIVDLRAFAAHRTDIAREIYTVAEIVAGAALWDATTAPAALRKTMLAAATRLSGCTAAELRNNNPCGHTAGWMRVAVVARPRDDPGDPTASPAEPPVPANNTAGNPCNPAPPATPPFCEPNLLYEVDFNATTTGVQRADWGGAAADGNACAQTNADTRMPQPTANPPTVDIYDTTRRFAEEQQVLPNEDADPDGDGPAPAPAPSAWVSRTLNSDEWWAVVEVCTHFGGGTSTPGLFAGGMAGFAMDAFDAAGSGAWRRRVAWGAHETLDDCTWCGTAGAGTP